MKTMLVLLHLAMPAGWSASQHDGIQVYRSADRTQALTIATYALVRGATREAVLQRSAQARRAAERELAQGRLFLSAPALESTAGTSRLRYYGFDQAANRRFVNLIVASRGWMQNFYYEAIGMPELEFDRSSRAILGGIEVRALQRIADAVDRADGIVAR